MKPSITIALIMFSIAGLGLLGCSDKKQTTTGGDEENTTDKHRLVGRWKTTFELKDDAAIEKWAETAGDRIDMYKGYDLPKKDLMSDARKKKGVTIQIEFNAGGKLGSDNETWKILEEKGNRLTVELTFPLNDADTWNPTLSTDDAADVPKTIVYKNNLEFKDDDHFEGYIGEWNLWPIKTPVYTRMTADEVAKVKEEEETKRKKQEELEARAKERRKQDPKGKLDYQKKSAK